MAYIALIVVRAPCAVKANSKEETKAQMTDTELLGQITTFQLAGKSIAWLAWSI